MGNSDRCLEDFLVTFPDSPQIRLQIHLNPAELGIDGLKSGHIDIFKAQPQIRQTTDSPIAPGVPLQNFTYASTWFKSVLIDGVKHDVHFLIITAHHYRGIPREQGCTATTHSDVLSQGHNHPDNFKDHFLFNSHHEVLQIVLPGTHGDILDLAHRIALASFVFDDNNAQPTCLDFVSVITQTNRRYPSPDLSERVARNKKAGLLQHLTATVRMTRESYDQIKRSALKKTLSAENHTAFVALGSNVGDRLAMIESACRSMNARKLGVMRTSSVYETAPMYLEDQSPFLNGVCQVSDEMMVIECNSERPRILG